MTTNLPTYTLQTSQELTLQGEGTTYYHAITLDDLPGKHISNDRSIEHIIWHLEQGCLNITGNVDTSHPANLTILSPCVNFRDVTFANIPFIKVSEHHVGCTLHDITQYKEDAARVSIENLGTKDKPVSQLAIKANEVTIRGNNWIELFALQTNSSISQTGNVHSDSISYISQATHLALSSQITSKEIAVSGNTFTQEGRLFITNTLNIDCTNITLTASQLDVGAYRLRGTEIEYSGALDAKRGDLRLEYLGAKSIVLSKKRAAIRKENLSTSVDSTLPIVKGLFISQDLQATGKILLHTRNGVVVNTKKLTAHAVEIIAASFHDYGQVNTKEKIVVRDSMPIPIEAYQNWWNNIEYATVLPEKAYQHCKLDLSDVTFSLQESQTLTPQGNGATYYHPITLENLPGRYIRNKDINHIIWHLEEGCLNLTGNIKATNPVRLTILSTCVNFHNVTFNNIKSVKVSKQDVEWPGLDIFKQRANEDAHISIKNLGIKNNPVPLLSIKSQMVTIEGKNHIKQLKIYAKGSLEHKGSVHGNQVSYNSEMMHLLLGSELTSKDLSLKGTSCIQEGALTVTNTLDTDCTKVRLARPDLLDVGAYHLRFTDIDYSGKLHAKRGDLRIECLEGKPLVVGKKKAVVKKESLGTSVDSALPPVRGLFLDQELHAAGKIILHTPNGVVVNNVRLTAKALHVIAKSFHDYKQLSMSKEVHAPSAKNALTALESDSWHAEVDSITKTPTIVQWNPDGVYELQDSQTLKPQNGSATYYQIISPTNLPGRNIDNAGDLDKKQPINHIVWYLQQGCLHITGNVKTTHPAELTIISPCIKFLDVTFENICTVHVSVNDIRDSSDTIYKGPSLSDVVFSGIGTQEIPAPSLDIMASNIATTKENWVARFKAIASNKITQSGVLHGDHITYIAPNTILATNSKLESKDLIIKGITFIQEGELVVVETLNVDCNTIQFICTELLEVGVYELRGTRIDYSGMLDAKSGDFQIEYLGGKFMTLGKKQGVLQQETPVTSVALVVPPVKGYFMDQVLRATGKVILRSSGAIVNTNQIVADDLEVKAISFHNYMYVNINEDSTFYLQDTFSNHAGSEFRTSGLYVGTKNKARINKATNEGVLYSANTEIRAKKTEISAIDFAKRTIGGVDSVIALPKAAHWNCKGDFYLHSDELLVRSSKLYITDRFYSNNAYIHTDNFFVGSHIYKSIIHAVKGIEGSSKGIELISIGRGGDNLLEGQQDNIKQALVAYSSDASSTLARIADAQRRIFFQYLSSTCTTSCVALSMIPNYGPLNTKVYQVNPNLLSLLNTDGIHFLFQRAAGIVDYERTGALVSKDYFGKFTDFLLSHGDYWFLLGDQHYLERLFEDKIFESIGVITGMDNVQLAEALIMNAINTIDGEKVLADKRGSPFEIGKPLREDQVQTLGKPIAWFVSMPNCLATGKSCLFPVIYFTTESIKNFIWENSLSSEGAIKLELANNVLLDSNSGIRGKQIDLKVGGHVISFGKLQAEEVNIASSKDVLLAGEVQTGRELMIKAINIVLVNKVQSGGDVTLEAAEDIAIQSLVSVMRYGNKVESKVSVEGVIESRGKVTLDARNVGVRGARVVGNDVYIRAGDKVMIVPAELYYETVETGKRFYYKYQATRMHESFVLAKGSASAGDVKLLPNGAQAYQIVPVGDKAIAVGEGSIVITSGAIGIRGGTFKGAESIVLACEEGKLIVEASVEGTEEYSRHTKKKWFRKKTTTRHSVSESVHSTQMEAPNVWGITLKEDQYWIGVNIIAKTTRLIAGTPEHTASVSILPAHKMSMLEVHTKKSGFTFKFQNNGITFAEKTMKGRGSATITPVPSVLQVENEFYVYASGNYMHVQPVFVSDGQGKMRGIINAQNIDLSLAPEIKMEYSYLNRIGTGIGFSAKGGEYAVKAFTAIESKKWSKTSVQHNIPAVLEGFLTLDATESISDAGILYHARQLQMNSKFELHGVAINVETTKEVRALLEAGIKFGIRSNMGVLGVGKELIEGKYESPEDILSAASRSWKLYIEVLKLLSKNAGSGFAGGGWFYLEGTVSEETSRTETVVPTRMMVDKLEINTEHLEFVSTQINAWEAYINTKYLKVSAAQNRYQYRRTSGGISAQIPITGSVTPSLQAFWGEMSVDQVVHLNTNIHVTDRLVLDVAVHADISGGYIEAGELEASFGSLMLESVQDILEIQGKGLNLGFAIDRKSVDSIGGHLQDRTRHVVDSLTALVGRDSTNVVVTNALMLNGAMIANAERDETGKFTDHGHLTLTVGELFIKHIYDYDSGLTLQAAVNFADNTKIKDAGGHEMMLSSLEATLGFNRGEGWTRATIGAGDVTCTKEGGECNLDTANRNVECVQNFDTVYELKPVFLYYDSIDTKKLREGLPGSIKEFVTTTINRVKAALGLAPQKSVVEEAIEELDEKVEKMQEEYEELKEDARDDALAHQAKQLDEVQALKDKLEGIDKDLSAGNVTLEDANNKVTKAIANALTVLESNYKDYVKDATDSDEYAHALLAFLTQLLLASSAALAALGRKRLLDLASDLPSDKNKLSYDDFRREKLAKFHSLVSSTHITAKELSILKDIVVLSNEKEIKQALKEKKYDLRFTKLELVSSKSGDDGEGFFGALFSRALPNGEKIYIEVYKPTDDPEKRFGKATYDLVDDFKMGVFKKMPKQAQSAELFHLRVMTHVRDNKNLYGAGFSLGNALMQIMGAKYIDDFKSIIGFDGPGMQEFFEKNNLDLYLEQLKAKTVLFNLKPHLVNVWGTHIVDPIFVDTETEVFSNVFGANHLKEVHDSKAMTEAFDDDGPRNIIEIKSWPKHFSGLGTFHYDYERNKKEWDKHFEKEWSHNPVIGIIGGRVMLHDKYKNFDDYKQSRIEDLKRDHERYKRGLETN